MGDFRELSQWESEVLLRLLAVPFPGRDEIAGQLHGIRCRTIDDDGSIEFSATAGRAAPVLQRVPVEAEAKDADNVPLYLLLHVVDGFVRELELYKADGSRIMNVPRPLDLSVYAGGARPVQ